MSPIPVTRREFIRWALWAGFTSTAAGTLLTACADSCPECPIGWQPDVLAPVFYGWQEFAVDDGAPGSLRIWFPSLDGNPEHASILSPSRGRFPLVLFLHGQCSDAEHYKAWDVLPAELARSGYVVVVPDLGPGPGPPWAEGESPARWVQVFLEWARAHWGHREQLMPAPATAVIGHSYGAMWGGRFVASAPETLSAYASIGGGWLEWPGSPPLPLADLRVPALFIRGDEDVFAEISPRNGLETFWNQVPRPKHSIVLDGGTHFDHLRTPNDIKAACGGQQGPCNLIGYLTADLVTVFLSKYIPPENSGIPAGFIPDTLTLPHVRLTEGQHFYAGAHLPGLSKLPQESCGGEHIWETTLGSGSDTLRHQEWPPG
jgi:pimeloyl-ACP methyl ester carboxylesterase